jgi:hypothetical protein
MKIQSGVVASHSFGLFAWQGPRSFVLVSGLGVFNLEAGPIDDGEL